MPGSQSEMLSSRELLTILWRGKWVLVATALTGLAWGLIVAPPGQSIVTGTVQLRTLGLPSGRTMAEIDWLDTYLVSAGFPAAGQSPAGAPYSIAVTRTNAVANVTFSAPSNDEAATTAAMERLTAAGERASASYLGQAERRLAALSRMPIAPGGFDLVFQEMLGLQSFLDTARPNLFQAKLISVQQVPKTPVTDYFRRALLGLAAGIILVLSFYLLRNLIAERK